MKTLKFMLIITATVLFISCNNNRTNRKADRNETGIMVNNDKTDNSSANNKNVIGDGKDVDFLKNAANGGMMEVELGKYAEQHAQSPRVKNFGAMMVRDHSKANDELRTLAKNKNFVLPNTMEDKHNRTISNLQQKTGNDFDKDYIKNMVDDHQDDIDEFKKQAENGDDADLKAFASKILPVLQSHLDSAKSIQKILK